MWSTNTFSKCVTWWCNFLASCRCVLETHYCLANIHPLHSHTPLHHVIPYTVFEILRNVFILGSLGLAYSWGGFNTLKTCKIFLNAVFASTVSTDEYCICLRGTCIQHSKQTNLTICTLRYFSLSTILGFKVVVCFCSVVTSVSCADLRWLNLGLIKRHH